MRTPIISSCVVGLSLFLSAHSTRAEDIDIFGQMPANGANPNIMIILDNASAWNADATFSCPTPGAVHPNNVGKDVGFEQCALHEAIKGIGQQSSLLGRVNIGLMMFGSNQNGGGAGGTIYYPGATPTRLPLMDLAGIDSFQTYIKAIDRQVHNANGSQIGGGMQEAFAFFTGRTGVSGRSYSSHIEVSCQRNFIIYIANALNNGKPQDQGQIANNYLQQAVAAYNAPVSLQNQINTANLGQFRRDDDQWGDEWARFLYQTDLSSEHDDKQNVITYTIAVTDGSNPEYVQHTKSMARQGGGKAFEVTLGDVSGLVQALLQIFNEVQSVNTAFSSASLPVSGNTQGTYLNQVYIGMFRPNGTGAPRWNGNLKQYQFGVDVSDPAAPQLFLADRAGDPAISNASTGFLAPTAISFWTRNKSLGTYPDSLGGFWVSNPNGAGGGFDTPDGEVIEKGGAAQQTRVENLRNTYSAAPGSASNPRRLYTCTNGTGLCGPNALLSATPFATTNADLTQAALGLSTTSNLSISSVTRTTPSTSSTAGTAIVTLAATPSLALTNNQQVVVAGFSDPQLNGTKTITLIGTTGTQFSYPITEHPALNATGSYTASKPAGAAQGVTSITRSGTTATITMPTVNGTAGGFQAGEKVQISGASESAYNLLVTIGTISATQFTYTVTTTTSTTTNYPSTPAAISGASGSCTKGSSVTSLGPITGVYLKSPTTTPSTRVIVTTQNALPGDCTSGNPSITITGVTDTITSPSVYNVNQAAVVGTTVAACDTSLAAGTRVICYDITPGTTSVTGPASPATAASGQTIQATRAASTATITSMNHASSTCGMGSGTPNVTVTANTAAAHGFVTGDFVTISGVAAANEGAYLGTFPVTVVNPTRFTFSMTTTPRPTSITAPCPLNIAGVTITASTTGAPPATLINWVRGQDDLLKDELSPDPTYANVNIRPSLHGDVLHSRPVIVNYAADKIVAFYGSNDGIFRAVNANQTASIGTVAPGGELWGFVAQEFFPKLSRLYLNSPSVLLKTTPSGLVPPATAKDYFFDGNVGVFKDATRTYIYLSARRGGRFVYALDVTDPAAPRFLWRKTSDDYPEMGYTWSEPKVALVRGHSNPVLIMGAGYDTTQDVEPPLPDTMGRGILVLDATDGSLLWQAGPGGSSATQCTGNPCQLTTMTYSIPADVTLIDRTPRDGKIERAYAADTGGNIWRLDFESAAGNAPANWKVTRFAALGGTPASGGTKRKFLFPPDVIATRDFDLVLASTGDREHPLIQHTATYGMVNRFYSMKDRHNGIGSNAASPPSTWTPITDDSSTTSSAPPSSAAGLFDCSTCATGGTLYDVGGTTHPNGFFVVFPHAGEKGVNRANSIGGFTYFGTNTPVDPAEFTCATSLGVARGYKVNSFTGATLVTTFDGGGFPPSPMIGLVTVTFPGASTPTTVPFLIGGGIPEENSADARSPFGGQIPTLHISGKRVRKYWNTENNK